MLVGILGWGTIHSDRGILISSHGAMVAIWVVKWWWWEGGRVSRNTSQTFKHDGYRRGITQEFLVQKMMNNHPGMTDCFTPQLPISDPPSQQSTIQHHIFTSSYCLQIHQSSRFYKRKKISWWTFFHHRNITEGHKSHMYEYLIKSIKIVIPLKLLSP